MLARDNEEKKITLNRRGMEFVENFDEFEEDWWEKLVKLHHMMEKCWISAELHFHTAKLSKIENVTTLRSARKFHREFNTRNRVASMQFLYNSIHLQLNYTLALRQ